MHQDFRRALHWERVLWSPLAQAALTFLALGLSAPVAEALPDTPLYPVADIPYVPIGEEITTQVWLDWNSVLPQAVDRPDRSYRSVWVRMFPTLSNPLGDPYPNTQDLDHATLVNAGGFQVYSLKNHQALAQATKVEVDAEARVVVINDSRRLPLEPMWIVPAGLDVSQMSWDEGKDTEVRIRLRGGFVVNTSIHESRENPPKAPRELWSVINVVPINQYIQSVVPSEIISSWHQETMKAQAIAARTYGLYEVGFSRSRGLDFDVDPTTWYQSYQGVEFWNRVTRTWRTIEWPRTTEAVKATAGQVMVHRHEIIKAFFSANSGGRTCELNECLPENLLNAPYIHAVDDHPDIRTVAGGTWGDRADITPQTIRDELAKWGLELPKPVRRLEHLEKGESGRTWRLRIIYTDGTSLDLDRFYTKKVMRTFGALRSYWYELGPIQTNGKQKIRGWGYGHGVGMSQWGAQLFALQGWSAQRILRHYYNGISITRMSRAAELNPAKSPRRQSPTYVH